MSSFLQQDLSTLPITEMRYDPDESMIGQQNEANDGTESGDIEGLVANEPWLDDLSSSQSVQRLLLSFNQAICERLEAIERRLDSVNDFCQTLEEKVEMLSSLVRESNNQSFLSSAVSPVSTTSSDENESTNAMTVGSNFTLITLNSEADYPNGSWLGDETNPDMRVRTHISPTDLFHISTICQTPEKMALTLLDYLFDRETQACSNISGTGKHKKKQLDPLLIYGIRCHLISKFNINNSDWNRIKQNIDSKCRTAFRRKQKGLPLFPKGQSFSPVDGIDITMDESVPIPDDGILTTGDEELSSNKSIHLGTHCVQFALQPINNQDDLSTMMPNTQVIRTDHGEFQVLHATPEQIAEIQQTHQIQILNNGQLLLTTMDEPPTDETSVKSEVLQSLEDGNISSAEKRH